VIRVEYEGKSFYPFELDSPYRWPDTLDEETRRWLQKALTKGKFYDEGNESGAPMTGVEQRRLAANFLGTYDHWPEPGKRPEGGPKLWLIPDVWPCGYNVMLGGNPKAGKSTIAIDLLSAAMNGPYDGRRFLDYFEVTQLTKDQLESRPVWYINAENPPDALVAAMFAAGLGEWYENGLVVEHLEYLGGARAFDLTDAEIYAWWEVRLTQAPRSHWDDQIPLIVIVDGLTAILGGTTAKYGEWYSRFRDLLKSLGIPNALVIAHSTLAGDHLMGGVEAQAGSDGNWNLERTKSGKRLFSVQARMGGKDVARLEVRLDPDGRLRAGGNPPPAGAAAGAGPSPVAPTPQSTRNLKAEVLKAVTEAYAAGVQPSGSKIRQAVRGRNEDIDEALSALVGAGQIEQFKATGPSGGGGFAYRPVSRAT